VSLNKPNETFCNHYAQLAATINRRWHCANVTELLDLVLAEESKQQVNLDGWS
jgi:hypothetical protein